MYDEKPTSLKPTSNQQKENTWGRIREIFADLGQDFSEIGTDQALKKLTDNEIVNDIPVVKTLVGTIKSGFAIRDWHYSKKLCRFLVDFQDENHDISELEKYRDELENEDKKQRVVEHLIVTLDRIHYETKVTVLAKLFQAYLYKESQITWERFVSLTVCLDSLNPAGFLFLHTMAEKNWHYNVPQASEGEVLLIAAGIGARVGTKFSVFDLGRQLYTYGIKYVLSDLQSAQQGSGPFITDI